MDQIEFAGIERIGEIVRAATQVSRVIALGGEGVSRDQILASIRTREDGLTGVDSPASGVYKRGYRSRHMGYGIDPGRQLPAAVLAAGRPVGLVGKMQDIIHCPRAQRVPAVATDLVLREFGRLARELEAGLVAATIQETDLAGHAQDARQYGALLAMTDAWLAEFLPTLRPGDLLVVTGDHGNDPGIGHPQHTREKTPLLVYGPGLKVVDLGERATLSDIAATLARHLGAAAPENGCSFYEKLD